MAAHAPSNSNGIEVPIPVGNGSASTGYFGLDAVRASAMGLGVLDHAILFGGGMMIGTRGADGEIVIEKGVGEAAEGHRDEQALGERGGARQRDPRGASVVGAGEVVLVNDGHSVG